MTPPNSKVAGACRSFRRRQLPPKPPVARGIDTGARFSAVVFFFNFIRFISEKKVDESPRQTLPDAVDIGLRPNFFALGFYETDLKKKTTFKQKFKFSEQLKPNHQILHRNWTCSIKPNWASKSNTLLRK